MTKALMVANWKMNKTVPEAVDLVRDLLTLVADGISETVVAPPFTAMHAVARVLEGNVIGLAAQNMHWEQDGAYTGEISSTMLRDIGCRFVILGHSERRQYFGEGDVEVARKAGAALREGLIPILCVGETLGERDCGKTFEVVERQIRGGLEGVVPDRCDRLVIAYEPVWAIGTGKTAGPEAAQEVHVFIRDLLGSLLGGNLAGDIRILYGGSVKPDNVDTLMAMPDINGALVGGAGLDADSFARIVNYVVS